MPKYSTDQDAEDATEWRSDTRHVFAEWSTKPFVGHRHKYETVEHRLVVEYTHDVGADLLHEVRSTDSGKFPDDWQAVETLELRDYGARLYRGPEVRHLR